MVGVLEITMKQHITSEQLNQASKRAQENFFEWYHHTKGIVGYKIMRSSLGVTHQEDVSVREMAVNPEHITIGVLIEFLTAQTNRAEETLAIDAGEHEWHVYHINKPSNVTAPELCDALWLSSLKILEKI